MARILLVDDDPAQLEIRALLLEREGHEVCSARTVDEATRAHREVPADIALMDLRLPRSEDGLALIRWLREASSALRIIVLSGWAADLAGAPEMALVDRLLAKPVRTGQLLDLIREISQCI